MTCKGPSFWRYHIFRAEPVPWLPSSSVGTLEMSFETGAVLIPLSVTLGPPQYCPACENSANFLNSLVSAG